MEKSTTLSDKDPNPVEPYSLRIVMRNWTTGVAIVTSRWKDEQHGMTVSSFSSVSLDPPLVSVSLAGDTRTHRLVSGSGIFGVTILADDQLEISDRFAGRIDDALDRFSGLNFFALTSGAPFIEGGLAYIDCRVASKLEAGHNTLFLGEVIAVKSGQSGAPLLYFDQHYQKICE